VIEKQINVPEFKKKLINFYIPLPNDGKYLLALTFDLAREHLYQPIDSNITIECLDNIISIIKKSDICLPDFTRISFSKFSEDGGWGKEFDWYSIWT
jgi:hypothetical protein